MFKLIGRMYFYLVLIPQLVHYARRPILNAVIAHTNKQISNLPEDHPARHNWKPVKLVS